MPITTYRQNELWKKKGEFLILREWEGKSIRALARIFKVNRETISRFIHSKRYQEVLFLIEGDRAIREILKCWNKYDVDLIFSLNRVSEEEIKEELQKKYPEILYNTNG